MLPRQDPSCLPIPSCSQPPSLPGTPSAAAVAAHVSPALSPCAPVPAAEPPLDSRDTSSQESNEPLRAAGAGRLSRKSRSAMSSRLSLAADAGDQADTPRRARTQAHAMLDLQRQQMEQERCQLQVRCSIVMVCGWQHAAWIDAKSSVSMYLKQIYWRRLYVPGICNLLMLCAKALFWFLCAKWDCPCICLPPIARTSLSSLCPSAYKRRQQSCRQSRCSCTATTWRCTWGRRMRPCCTLASR